MIDEEWLKGLSFNVTDDVRVTGLAGIGSENVVFSAETSAGKKLVIRARQHHLGFHIKELPIFLTGEPRYDIERLNRKLLARVGDPLFDSMTAEYDRLYASIIKTIYEVQVQGLILSVMTQESTETIPFILHTPGVKRRLAEIASLSESEAPEDLAPSVNGSNFRIVGYRPKLREWAKKSLAAIDRLGQQNPDIVPATLHENPLFIWGAAAMDGFITDDEMGQVASFINQQFGPLTSHERVATFIAQANAIANLLCQFLEKSEVARFVKLCAKLGCVFQATDRHGRVVADGFSELRA